MNKMLGPLAGMSWGVVAGVALLIAALFYFTMYDDGSSREQQIKNAKAKYGESQIKLKRVQQQLTDTNKFMEEVGALDKQVQDLLTYLPPTINVLDFQQDIQTRASLAGTSRFEIQVNGKTDQKDFYETKSFAVKLAGTYSQIMQFLSLVTQVKHLITFEDISLVPIEAKEPGEPKLQFSGVLVAYRYVKVEPDKDKAGETPKPVGGG